MGARESGRMDGPPEQVSRSYLLLGTYGEAPNEGLEQASWLLILDWFSTDGEPEN